MRIHAKLFSSTPAWLSCIGENIIISGWFFDEQGWPAKQVRIRLGDRIINCQPQACPDVLAQCKNGTIHDAAIGFHANFRTKPGAKYITIEAQTRKGEWRVFGRRLFFVKKQYPDGKSRKIPAASETKTPETNTEKMADLQLPAKPLYDLKTQSGPAALASISIVIPTYNRADLLARVVRRAHELVQNQGMATEWIIIDDGSSDHTPAVLRKLAEEIPNFQHKSVKNGGAGQARNMGASMARNEVILFMGDDILPANEDFLRIHAQLHAEYKSARFSVLGKVVWGGAKEQDVNAVMRHIQGRGGEQFGYADFTPYAFYDWRFFYTANVSVKRNIIADWKMEGFSSAFTLYGYEDGEFAYRMGKKHGRFDILYVPSSIGQHMHSYTVASFLRRQTVAGTMAATFGRLHPEALPLLGVNEVREVSMSRLDPGKEKYIADYLTVLEGIKSWAKILEGEGHLGNQAWHDELLSAVFEAAYLQAYLQASATGTTNFERGYACILNRMKIRMNRIFDSEVRADELFKKRMLAM